MSQPRNEALLGQSVMHWQRQESACFRFAGRDLDPATGVIELEYELDGMPLVEWFELPGAPLDIPDRRAAAIDKALDLLHWTAGVSYWKAGCPNELEFAERTPDRWQADWLTRLWREGLAEFAWCNELDVEAWPRFEGREQLVVPVSDLGLPRRSLVPMGGGKDSLVALERLRAAGEVVSTVQVGNARLIADVAARAGQSHLVVRRRVDPLLGELNRRGAFNGHVPITAINSAALVVLALAGGYGRVVFANERSADEQTLIDDRGRAVNHQFSKSYAFERMLQEWIKRHVATDLEVFSILRRDRELAICREFAALEQYHDVFSSCNRNFHLDGRRVERWCGQCPKCHFVFLALAPFMSPERLRAIFGHDLLADRGQAEGFGQLLALEGVKPFECVGEAVEARSALVALGAQPSWRDHAVVRVLLPRLEGWTVPSIDELCRPGGDHLIPDDLLAHA
jgi:UDP-N-acetyl-alpha-D-muramoyl-L-alanyl-L-glutamate epimerase